uniref:hypothetical protein n=1 Tax=uncultured Ruminococcus sp. TaxID=165186 RepID=UPI00292FD64B
VREENMIKGNYFDYLTGLPNMSYFFELAHEWRKLDLFVTEQVLEKMKKQAEAGLFVVSESVNLSRADFPPATSLRRCAGASTPRVLAATR